MVSTLYFITFAASVIMTGWFVFRNKKTDSLYIIFCLLIVLNSLGRYLLSISDTLKMAIISNQLIYLGGCFCPLMLIIGLQQLCNIRISKAITRSFLIMSSAVMCLLMTTEKTGLYYRKVSLGTANGCSYLIKTYGPLHFTYMLLLILYGVLMTFYLIYAFKKRNHIPIRTVSIISIMGCGVVLIYFFEKILHTNISYISIAYLIAAMSMVFLLERVSIYDITTNIAGSIDRLREYGYIEFDRKLRYINANQFAKELFPEIESEWCIDRPVPKSQSLLYTNVIADIENGNLDRNKTIVVNGLYFQVDIRNIIYGKNRNVGYIIELIDRTTENNYLNTIKNYNSDLEHEVAIKTANISRIKDSIVIAMSALVDSRDNSTGEHIKRTSCVVDIFTQKLLKHNDTFNFSKDFLHMVVRAAPMHDLGKISVPDMILQKNGKFTDEEYEIMKKHAYEGARILKNILSDIENEEFIQLACNVAHYHHEKWDGSGYPDGIKGTDIPVEARIMALADVFDALVSKRCYKEAYSYDKSFKIIEDSLGSHFDPELGKVFLECRPELEKFYDTQENN